MPPSQPSLTQQLWALQEVTQHLAVAETTDELCRRAVELGRSHLGFDRMSIWFIDEEHMLMRGSFGTDELGNLRDERTAEVALRPEGLAWQVYSRRESMACVVQTPLTDHQGRIVGEGQIAMGALWDGDAVIGIVSVDNLLQREPIGEDQKEILRLYASTLGHMITRRHAEDTLRAKNQEMRNLAESSPGLMATFYLRPDGTMCVPYASRRLWELFGLRPEEVARDAAPLLDRTHPEDAARVRESIAGSARTMTPWHQEYRVLHPTRGEIWVEGSSNPTAHPDGGVIWYGFVHDITVRKRAEEASRASEALLRTFLDHATDAFFFHNADGTILDVNRRACEMLGYTHEELIGSGPEKFDSDLTPEKSAEIRSQLDTGKSLTFETRHRRKDGTVFPVEVHVRSFRHGARRYGVSLAHDITERKRAEEALHASQQAFVSLVNTVDGIVWEADAATFRFLFVSAQAKRILGYSPAEWLENPRFWAEHLHPDDRDEAVTYCANATREMRDHNFEYRMIAADGRVVWMHDLVTVVMEDGQPVRLRGLMVDITARRQAEEALRARHQEFQALAENAPDAICRFGRDCRLIYVNPTYVSVLGRTPEQLLGRTPEEVYPGVTVIKDYQRKVQEVLSQGTSLSYETSLEALHEEPPHWYHIRLVPERDREGRVVSVLNVGRDITALKETERQLRSLTENSPDIIVRYDRHGRYLYVNAAMERITGIPVAAYLGRPVGEIAARDRPEVVAQFRELGRMIARVCADNRPGEAEMHLPLPHGETVFHVRLIPERNETQQVASVLMIAQDITARKRIEEALRVSEQRFRQVTENIDEVFWLTDVAKSQMIYISPAYERLWGRKCETLYAHPQSWLDAVHPDDRERVRTAAQTLQAVGAYDLEYRVLRPDGTVRWVHDRAFPIADPHGQVYRLAGVAEDITEKHLLEDQLRQLQKMEAIGELAGGIAHDFNNILTGMLGAAEIARLEVGATHAALPWLDNVIKTGKRAKELVAQILTFSRRSETEKKPQQLAHVVEEAVHLLRSTLPSMVELQVSIAPHCPPVLADATQIHQVVMNLCTNAWHALPEQGGRIEIDLRPVTVTAEDAARRLGLTVGPYLRLCVRDNGTGMPPEVLRRVFEPFFTTKKHGHGTGLGLAVVHGIVQSHHGAIFAESAPEAGTSFEIFLPVPPPEALAPDRPAPAASQFRRGHGEHILLVDDNAAGLISLRGQLERLGYRVTAQSDPVKALEVFLAAPPDFNLLLTDYAMPVLTGDQLAIRILAVRPDLPVLLTSGHMEPERQKKLLAQGVREVLAKPPSLSELAEAVARSLPGSRKD
jgi:PAS domain S-box-containing protein